LLDEDEAYKEIYERVAPEGGSQRLCCMSFHSTKIGEGLVSGKFPLSLAQAKAIWSLGGSTNTARHWEYDEPGQIEHVTRQLQSSCLVEVIKVIKKTTPAPPLETSTEGEASAGPQDGSNWSSDPQGEPSASGRDEAEPERSSTGTKRQEVLETRNNVTKYRPNVTKYRFLVPPCLFSPNPLSSIQVLNVAKGAYSKPHQRLICRMKGGTIVMLESYKATETFCRFMLVGVIHGDDEMDWKKVPF
jgi:hypothetical protein